MLHHLVSANCQVPGESVYGEKRVSVESGTTEGEKIEYRVWNPFRSKLAASVLAGVDNVHIKPGSKVGHVFVAYSRWLVARSSQVATAPSPAGAARSMLGCKGVTRCWVPSQVLYLGAASGTSVSHVSDIVGPDGSVYAVEFSHRSGARDMIATGLGTL